uniref:Uncharacterized protein n=1 Tax=Bombyx mori TaxID=7091 RepID=A0A8R2R5A8_BOMMO|nr:uncharacterized protein LOC110385500 isoform X1 [Bombyx mori]
MCRNNQELLEVTFAGERAGDHGFNSRTTGRSLIKRWNCTRSTSFQIKGETSETVHVEKSSEVTNNTVELRDSLFLKYEENNDKMVRKIRFKHALIIIISSQSYTAGHRPLPIDTTELNTIYTNI